MNHLKKELYCVVSSNGILKFKQTPQSRSNFLTRASQLNQRLSFMSSKSPRNEATHPSITTELHRSEIHDTHSRSPMRVPGNRNLDARDGNGGPYISSRGSTGERRKSIHSGHRDAYTNAQRHQAGPKVGLASRPVGGTEKLGTLSGVFVPTTLNVLSILMFLRFGFILGQSGFLGMMGKFIGFYSLLVLYLRD